MADEPRMKFADLDEEGVNKVRALEQDIGGCVVALERRISLRNLSPEELEKLQSAEEDLGVVLMAYECE
jgi:hypothetical protein